MFISDSMKATLDTNKTVNIKQLFQSQSKIYESLINMTNEKSKDEILEEIRQIEF